MQVGHGELARGSAQRGRHAVDVVWETSADTATHLQPLRDRLMAKLDNIHTKLIDASRLLDEAAREMRDGTGMPPERTRRPSDATRASSSSGLGGLTT